MSLLDDLTATLDKGREAIQSATDPAMLESVRVEYLGKKGKLKSLMTRIKEVSADEKKSVGQKMNEVKEALTALLEEKKSGTAAAPSGPRPDPTLPGRTQPRGTTHPLVQTASRVVDIFERLGFTVAEGPEVEDDFHNFDALNIPADHPARDDFDTFFLDRNRILRSQTSSVQIRVMETTEPPLRVIAPGRVYRPDTVDATHYYGFRQIEGLAVDERVTFADLKAMLAMFAKELFGEETTTRFRPSFFPFTEPSAEMDVSCVFCHAKGCRICKNSGWIEILGCGMVDPNVFTAVKIDPEKWTGFAFGMGVERIAMLSLGVTDIRRFFENDLRFLRQFP